MSADAILEMIAFWGSVIAATYFFNKGRKLAGWISVACVILLPILVGLIFVLTGSNTKANRTPLSQVPALRPMQDAQRPTFTEPITLFGESQDLPDAPKPTKNVEVGGERNMFQAASTRREERIAVTTGKIVNPEYDARTVTVDRSDESTIWDYIQETDGSKSRYGYVEKVNDRGELVVSTVVGGGSQKILNFFHVLPLYGSYSTAYSSGLNDCQKRQQVDYLQKNLPGKKLRVSVYANTDAPLCGLSSRLFYPDLLASLGADKNDPKLLLSSVSLASDVEAPWLAQSLTKVLAEEGYLQTEQRMEQICANQYDPSLKRAIEIAKVQRKGFWGMCR